ncbi:MAG: tryptophan synthase subunit alpha [Vicinamibacteria bacterium]
MSIADIFETTRARNEIALIPYVTAGYPSIEASLDFIDAAAAAGADAIEIGLPFSDPVADGPTIQFASQQALEAGFRLRPFLNALTERRPGCPLIVMTYLNPLLALGPDAFALLSMAGVSALVIPDLPAEESAAFVEDAARSGIDIVLLVAPTSSNERLRAIGSASRGFVYVVGVVGTTGARREADPELPRILERVRAATSLPLVAGFGLSEPSHIQAITQHADGAIVGSRLVNAIRQGEDFAALIHSFKKATRRH